MKNKSKPKKLKKLNKELEKVITEAQLGALLENFNDNLRLVSENQIGTNDRLNKLENRFDGLEGRFDGLEGRFDGLEGRFDGLENRFDGSENRFDSFEKRTEDNFKLVFEHFSNIEDELGDIKSKLDKIEKDKIDKKEFCSLKIRVEKLEKKLEKIKSEAKC